MSKLKYRRVVLKISGEGLCRPGGSGIDPEQVRRIAEEIKQVADLAAEVAVVIGGGNIVRGAELARDSVVPKPAAHYAGMLATVINAIVIQEVMESIGLDTRVQSAINIDRVCEGFIRRRAVRHLEKGRVVIFGGGTGNPFVTTDTCAALRASEIQADALLKVTKVDGVFTADPKSDPKATLIPSLSYNEVIDRRLAVMDLSAVVMCQENSVPIVVFNMSEPGHMRDVVLGKPIGTLICDPDAA